MRGKSRQNLIIKYYLRSDFAPRQSLPMLSPQMKRLEFLRLCALAGVAGSTGIASASEEAPLELSAALKEAGLANWSVREEGDLLRIRCKVGNFDSLARKAAALGDGKVKASGSSLSFERQGRRILMELSA